MFGKNRKTQQGKKSNVKLLREFRIGETVEVSVFRMSSAHKRESPYVRDNRTRK